jgi:hypothetical protein
MGPDGETRPAVEAHEPFEHAKTSPEVNLGDPPLVDDIADPGRQLRVMTRSPRSHGELGSIQHPATGGQQGLGHPGRRV